MTSWTGLPDDIVAGALVRHDGTAAAAGQVTADAHFRIGRVTKVFTNTVVLQLAAEHRVDVEPVPVGGVISTAADLDRFLVALFRGRLLPAVQQKLLFDVPDVPGAATNTRYCFATRGPWHRVVAIVSAGLSDRWSCPADYGRR